MGYKLLVVESPGKVKKLESFLGREWRVVASLGHVRDLPPDKLAVDIENGYAPTYVISRGKQNVVERLRDAITRADAVFLASDPDREGEAIAWHIGQVCKKELKGKSVFRVTFDSITKGAVLEAVRN